MDSRAVQRASYISIAVGALICAIKFRGYYVTSSQAIFTDALESIVNVVAAVFAAISIRQSLRGADSDHPYGHGKLEYFSAAFEGGLIALAGGIILWESIPAIFRGARVSNLNEGLLLVFISAILDLLLRFYLKSLGKKHHSVALIADGSHVLTDVYTTVGLLIGLVIVTLTGFTILDPIIASLMALWILYTGMRLMIQSYDRLMDKTDPQLLMKVCDALRSNKKEEFIIPHKMRVRESGNRILMDTHLVVPSYLTIDKLHDLESDLEIAISEELNRPVDLLLHADPCIPEYCKLCSMKKCPIRFEEQNKNTGWSADELSRDISHPFEKKRRKR